MEFDAIARAKASELSRIVGHPVGIQELVVCAVGGRAHVGNGRQNLYFLGRYLSNLSYRLECHIEFGQETGCCLPKVTKW